MMEEGKKKIVKKIEEKLEKVVESVASKEVTLEFWTVSKWSMIKLKKLDNFKL